MKTRIESLLVIIAALLVLQGCVVHKTVKKYFDSVPNQPNQIEYDGNLIKKIELNTNVAAGNEVTVYYKNGHRNYAEADFDHDGKIEKRTDYYFTGVPWKVSECLNHDGKFDYWSYYKNGVLYKWAQDRDADGKADLVTLLTAEDPGAEKPFTIKKQFADDDHDGVFEKCLIPERPMPSNLIFDAISSKG